MLPKPLEPPENKDFRQKRIFRLPNGDIVIERNGLQTQYSLSWLAKQPTSVLSSLLIGADDTDLAHAVLQEHYSYIKAANNPFLKVAKARPPSNLSYEYDPPMVAIVTTGTGTLLPSNSQIWELGSEKIKHLSWPQVLEEDGVPEIQEEPKSNKDRFVPKRMVEID